jgi:hypothetical protein
MVKQSELVEVLGLEKAIKRAEGKLTLAKAKMKDMQDAMVVRLQAGEIQEKGCLRAYLRTEKGRAVVSWKDILIQERGALFVEDILQKAPRTPVTHLVVEEVQP